MGAIEQGSDRAGPAGAGAPLPPAQPHAARRGRRWPARAAWSLAGLLVGALLLRTFVGDVYHVDSGSMEPTLWGAEGGGEWVFVRYDRSPPARQELVIVQRAGEPVPIVKRVLGLPGESVQVSCGDLLVRGRRLPPRERRPEWVLVLDARREPIERRFPLAVVQRSLWAVDGARATVDARGVPRGSDLGVLRLHDPLDDDYLGPGGELVRGSTSANDARIECTIEVLDAGSELRLGLKEQADVFQAHVRADASGECEIAITRLAPQTGVATLASARAPLRIGERRRIAFENRDNRLVLALEGATPLEATYRENTFEAGDDLQEGRTFGYRVWFGGHGGRFAFSDLRVLRDLCYTERGAYGVGAPLDLGPDEYFVLGDFSSQSRDSREWGPVRAGEVVGRPVAVVWPPSRWRRIRSLEGDS